MIGRHVPPLEQPQDVVLYGFGRIGRLMARILIEKTDGGDCLRLRAIVVRRGKAPNDLVKRVAELSFGVEVDGDLVSLPGIVSRKKQIIPALKV